MLVYAKLTACDVWGARLSHQNDVNQQQQQLSSLQPQLPGLEREREFRESGKQKGGTELAFFSDY